METAVYSRLGAAAEVSNTLLHQND